MEVEVQNSLGASEFGIFFALFNFTYLFQIVNDLGLQNFNNRAISQNRDLVSSYYPKIFGMKLFLGLAFFALLFLGAFFMDYPPRYLRLLMWIGVNQALLSLLLYLRTNISGLGKFSLDSFISILDKLLLIILLLVLLFGNVFPEFKLEYFIWAQGISILVSVIVCYIIVSKQSSKWLPSFSFSFSRDLLKQSIPFALVVVLMSIYTRIDGVMIEALLENGKEEAGIYAASYRLLDAVNMLGFLFASLLLPMFSNILTKSRRVNELLSLAFRFMIVLSVSSCVIIFFHREDIMSLLYDDFNTYWSDLLGVLIMTFIPMSMNYIFGTLLTADHQLRKMNTLFLFGIALNVGLNLYLIPIKGGLGAAYATLITQSFIAIAQIIFVFKSFKLLGWQNTLGKSIVFAGALLLFCYFLNTRFEFSWEQNFFFSIIIALIIPFFTQLIQKDDFKVLTDGASKKIQA